MRATGVTPSHCFILWRQRHNDFDPSSPFIVGCWRYWWAVTDCATIIYTVPCATERRNRGGGTINRKKNWKNFTSWLRKQIREQTMKIQLIRDLKIGTATRTCVYSRKQLRQQRRARVLSCLMRMGVHHARRVSPSGSGREELSHLWSSGGATNALTQKKMPRFVSAHLIWHKKLQSAAPRATRRHLRLCQRSLPPSPRPLSSLWTAPSRPSSISTQVR